MTDPKSSYGDPVEEPRASDDVVGRANEGLAHAEAAGRGDDVVFVEPVDDRPDAAATAYDDSAASDADRRAADLAAADRAASDRAAAEDRAGEERAAADRAADEERSAAADRAAAEDRAVEERAAADRAAEERAAGERAAAEERTADAETAAYVPGSYSDRLYGDSSTTAAETARIDDAAEPARSGDAVPVRAYDAPGTARTDDAVAARPSSDAPTVVASSPQPIFVQAPEAPRPRGNRGAAGLIGLLAALCFGVLYLGVWLGLGALAGEVTSTNVGTVALGALATGGLWVPVVVFFVAFWLLGAVINRGRWAAWVIFGLVVGVAAWAGHVLGQLFDAPFWFITAREAAGVVETELLAPLAVAAFIIGRELTIWFGRWVAARGARMTELNDEAQREYERTLEAGPQLQRV